MADRTVPSQITLFPGSNQPKINLLGRDFAGIRRALLDLVRIRFPNEFKDFSSSGIGMSIIEVVAYSHAQLSYYVDAAANETFLATARTKEGMRRATAALNYTMRTATAAGASVSFFPSPPQSAKVRINSGTTFKAKNGTTWTVQDDVIIPENYTIYPADPTTEDAVIAVEGQSKEAEFTSDGTSWQRYIIPDSRVINDSITIDVDGTAWTEAESLIFSEGYGYKVDQSVSDGSASYSFTLTEKYPRTDNFLITVGTDSQTAVEWEQVDDFTSSTPTDTHYVLDVNSTTGVGTVTFGNGVYGAIPASGETIIYNYNIIGPQSKYQVVLEPDGLYSIRFGDNTGALIPTSGSLVTISYRVGGGTIGNIDIAQIDSNITGYLVTTGAAVTVRVQNTEAGAGAEDAETVDHARLYAPKFAASTGRAVTQDDYDGLLNTFSHPVYGAPSNAKADLHSTFPESNQVDLVIWARDSRGRVFEAPQAFMDSIKVYMESRADICHFLATRSGTVVYVDLDMDVAIKSTLNVSTILSNIRTAIINYFLSTQVLPGRDIHESQLITLVQSLDGVSYVQINGIDLARRSRYLYFTGDGVTQEFKTTTYGGYADDCGAPIVPGTFSISYGTKEITDDLEGNLEGDIDETGIAENTIVYEDTAKNEYDAASGGQDGPRFFTPWFGHYVYTFETGDITGAAVDVTLPQSDIDTIAETLVITDGVLFAYDNGTAGGLDPTGMVGDVTAPGTFTSVGGEVRVVFNFSSVPANKVYAYYIIEVPSAEFNGNPSAVMANQMEATPLSVPVREETVTIRNNQDIVVDDGLGNFEWGQNDTDTRGNANTIIYEDTEIASEDISDWRVPTTNRYRGRLLRTPPMFGSSSEGISALSPQIREGAIVITDGSVTIEDNGQNKLTGDALLATGKNRIYYEDTEIEDDSVGAAGSSTYVNQYLHPFIKYNGVHGATSPYVTITTTVKDPVDSIIYTVIAEEQGAGTGQFSDASPAGGPSSPYIVTGAGSAVDYTNYTYSLQLTVPTVSTLQATYTVLGGSFDFEVSSAFTGTPEATYRIADGGHFDLTYTGTNTGYPLYKRYDQATGGQFDLAFDTAPGVNDLVVIDYRYQYSKDVTDEVIYTATNGTTSIVSGKFLFPAVKKGSVEVAVTLSSGSTVYFHDDGAGNLTGLYLDSTSKAYVDYTTGVFEFTISGYLQSGSNVLATYVSNVTPEDVVPIANYEIADIADITLNHVEPEDF